MLSRVCGDVGWYVIGAGMCVRGSCVGCLYGMRTCLPVPHAAAVGGVRSLTFRRWSTTSIFSCAKLTKASCLRNFAATESTWRRRRVREVIRRVWCYRRSEGGGGDRRAMSSACKRRRNPHQRFQQQDGHCLRRARRGRTGPRIEPPPSPVCKLYGRVVLGLRAANAAVSPPHLGGFILRPAAVSRDDRSLLKQVVLPGAGALDK